jgi:elongation of very long chain fatty acids protein 6
MYSYYAVRSVGLAVPRKVAMAITSLQLSQMVVGVGVNVYAARVKGEGQLPCDVSSHHLNLGFAMYASYFCLFAHFFYKAYLQKKKMMMKEQTKAE